MLLARYFVADNVLDEVTFGWPRQKGGLQLKEHLALNLQRAFNWVCMLIAFFIYFGPLNFPSHLSTVFSGYLF